MTPESLKPVIPLHCPSESQVTGQRHQLSYLHLAYFTQHGGSGSIHFLQMNNLVLFFYKCNCIYVCLPDCLYVYYVYVGAYIVQMKEYEPLKLELQVTVSCSAWVLETELSPLKEQYMLVTTGPPF